MIFRYINVNIINFLYASCLYPDSQFNVKRCFTKIDVCGESGSNFARHVKADVNLQVIVKSYQLFFWENEACSLTIFLFNFCYI